MILYPNAKINLGLDVLRRRPDGYHDIATVMIPVAWRDILEIVPSSDNETRLTTYGRTVDCPPEKNLVMKAYRALSNFCGGLPPVHIYLEKIIPDGAGLGGGSADAAFTLKGLNEVFNLGLDNRQLADVAATIGADCPFFIYNKPAYCTGTGTEIDTDISLDLSQYTILIAKAKVAAVSTKDAYAGVKPRETDTYLPTLLSQPVFEWNGLVKNDFEVSVFPLLPAVAAVKQTMLENGAIYAAMSGSGASVFGFFESDKLAQSCAEQLVDCDICITSGKI